MELRPWWRGPELKITVFMLNCWMNSIRWQLKEKQTIVKFCIIDYLRSEKRFIGELRTQFSSPPGWTPTPICICHSLSYDLCLNPLGVDEKKFFLAYQN